MSNFEVIKNMDLESLARFLHNIQETTLKTQHVDDPTYWEAFLNKEENSK